MEAMVARSATWVAATCTDEVFELMRMGRSRSRISVVPCGVAPDRFTPGGPAAPRGAQHRIVSVGRFVPRKGFDIVIRALPFIPNTEFVIVGADRRTQHGGDVPGGTWGQTFEHLSVRNAASCFAMWPTRQTVDLDPGLEELACGGFSPAGAGEPDECVGRIPSCSPESGLWCGSIEGPDCPEAQEVGIQTDSRQ